MSAIDKIRDHYNSLSNGESKYFEEWDLTFYKEPINLEKKGRLFKKMELDPVSYTHLTLPTILLV